MVCHKHVQVTLVIDLASSDKHKYKFKGKHIKYKSNGYRRSSGVSMIGNYYLISSSILASITVYHRLAVCR
ncbi:unnamed protein product [Heterobilharzia americana]|nr:unnamed protein product [Heterobilharzia americana]